MKTLGHWKCQGNGVGGVAVTATRARNKRLRETFGKGDEKGAGQ